MFFVVPAILLPPDRSTHCGDGTLLANDMLLQPLLQGEAALLLGLTLPLLLLVLGFRSPQKLHHFSFSGIIQGRVSHFIPLQGLAPPSSSSLTVR